MRHMLFALSFGLLAALLGGCESGSDTVQEVSDSSELENYLKENPSPTEEESTDVDE